MKFATLTFSLIGAITGTASLLIMAKTAKELHTAKQQVDSEIVSIKAKVTHNAKVVKTALSAMEL